MKKARVFFFVLFVGITLNGFSQTAPKDFYAGKWEIFLTGTPNGDVKLLTNLIRQHGKLVGELGNATDATQPKRAITKVEETGDKLIIYFTSSTGDEASIDLTKIDNDNLKGNLMGMFDAKATRIKN